ncbi:hypothetical protein PCC8801_0372 [Rippkaea orientalis PCC 8801]|uniref:Uncharacterized protein n=2 Tax=Rippkaea TaxID=2546365 RepID=B7JU90_RIPO1|nr:hypothetical protein PCC8801_0372 [Rippkaea orientalis PCC 8801]
MHYSRKTHIKEKQFSMTYSTVEEFQAYLERLEFISDEDLQNLIQKEETNGIRVSPTWLFNFMSNRKAKAMITTGASTILLEVQNYEPKTPDTLIQTLSMLNELIRLTTERYNLTVPEYTFQSNTVKKPEDLIKALTTLVRTAFRLRSDKTQGIYIEPGSYHKYWVAVPKEDPVAEEF